MNMDRIIHAAIFTPMDDALEPEWGLPLLMWGTPGIGKTAAIHRVAQRAGLAVKVLSPAEEGEGGFGAVPCPMQEDDGQVFLRNPPRIWTKDHANGGLIFIDDEHMAAPALRPYLVGLRLGKRLGDWKAGPRVRVLGAANPASSSTLGYELSPEEANRSCHVQFTPPEASQWGTWLMAQGARVQAVETPALAEEARVLAAWPVAYARCVAAVSGFVCSARFGHLFNAQPDISKPEASRAWPSPRTWYYFARALASAMVHGLEGEDEEYALCAGFVGEGAADSFFEYRREVGVPDTEALLDGLVTFQHNKARPDVTDSVLRGIIAAITPVAALRRKERAAVAWEVFAHVAGAGGPDLVVPFAITMSGLGLNAIAVGKKLVAQPAMAALLELMRKANLSHEQLKEMV